MNAINALEVGQSELIYRKSVWDEQPALHEEHEQGIAPFSSLKAALEDLRFEMGSEEWDGDAPCWSVLEKWRLAKSGTWKNPYAYCAIGGEIAFFEKRRYDAKEHCWRASDKTYGGDFTGRLNVRTPFKTGDIVTLDCRPFTPLAHGLILLPERDGAIDCCFPRALVRCAGYSTEKHTRNSSGAYGKTAGRKDTVNAEQKVNVFVSEITRGPFRCLNDEESDGTSEYVVGNSKHADIYA